jgi:DUF1680 family protein
MRRLTCLYIFLVALAADLGFPAQAAGALQQNQIRDADFYQYAPLRPVNMTAVHRTSGFWAERYMLCRHTVVPEMKKALLSPENSACLVNFRIGAGPQKGTHQGTDWSDGDCYKWLESLAWLYAIHRDAQLDKEMDAWIELIARTQAADGYISTQIQLDPGKKRWENLNHHELYNMGHLMTASQERRIP